MSYLASLAHLWIKLLSIAYQRVKMTFEKGSWEEEVGVGRPWNEKVRVH